MTGFGSDLVKVCGEEKSTKYAWWKSTRNQGNGEKCNETT
jgi:hypothetical protein